MPKIQPKNRSGLTKLTWHCLNIGLTPQMGVAPIIPTTYDVEKRMKMTKSGVLIMIVHTHGFESDLFCHLVMKFGFPFCVVSQTDGQSLLTF